MVDGISAIGNIVSWRCALIQLSAALKDHIDRVAPASSIYTQFEKN